MLKRGVEKRSSRQGHILEIAGSNPASATKIMTINNGGDDV